VKAVYNRLNRLKRSGERMTLHRIVNEVEKELRAEIEFKLFSHKNELDSKDRIIKKLERELDFSKKTGGLIFPWS